MKFLGLKIGGGPYPIWLDVLSCVAYVICGVGIVVMVLGWMFVQRDYGAAFATGLLIFAAGFILGGLCGFTGLYYKRKAISA